jgi:HEAT repeat protein
MLFKSLALLTALLCAAFCVSAQTDFHSADLDTALSFIGLHESDFVSDRIWAEDDTFLLPKIREALQSPLAAYRVTHEFSSSIPSGIADAAHVNDMAAFLSARCPEEVCRSIDSALALAPSSDPFEPLLSAFALTERYRTQAFSRLSHAQQQSFLVALPLWFRNSELPAQDSLKGALHRSFGLPVDTTQKVDADSVLTLLALVDRQALSAATYAFARGVSLTAQKTPAVAPPKKPLKVAGVEGNVLATRQTPYGTFVIGGDGTNTYSGDFAAILDVGGDDRYLSRVGCGVGVLSHPVAAVIDYSGNDLYISGKSCDQACGILGFGGLVDLGGNDEYRAGSFSQGAAFCGAALFFDKSGNDTYRAQMFAQGAAACGMAVLADGEGRDVYDLGEYGQGFASTFGAAALVDGAGNDLYRAGGLENDLPLRPEDYNSYAQGFATGSRPRGGGGFALLHDLSGNDFYDAEIYGQGVGYWYSLGCLLDDSGSDAYSTSQYCQGAGIHLAAGVLEDGAGDDHYISRYGPGQGGAHDLAVGLLYDHSGDDQYLLSGGHGMAINNSAALFLDGGGNDDYHVTVSALGEGGTAEARGFGNMGVFVDAGGHDVYSDPMKSDSTVWFLGLYGVGYDVPRSPVRPREAPITITLVPADTQRTVEQIFHDAALWEVTDYRERVKRGRMSLEAKWREAIPWVAAHKLNTMDGLERRAIVELYKAHPDSAAPYLIAALDSKDRGTRRTAITTLGEMKYRGAVKALISKIPDETYAFLRPTLLYALGDIGDTSATSTVLRYSASKVERERIGATVSLGKLRNPRVFEAIIPRLTDTLFTVSSAAIIALGAQSPAAIPVVDREFRAATPQRQEALLASVKKMGERWAAVDSLKKNVRRLAPVVRAALKSDNPRVQAAAVFAASKVLEKRDLEAVRRRLAASNDPVLAARLKELDKTLR